MNELIAYGVIVLAALVIVQLLYWQLVRPALVRALVFDLYARRDELRRMAASGEVDVNSFVYRYLEDRIHAAVRVISELSAWQWLSYSIKHLRDHGTDESARFEREASKTLSNMKFMTILDAMKMMCVNSPWLAGCFVVFSLILLVTGMIKKAVIIQHTDDFLGSLQPA